MTEFEIHDTNSKRSIQLTPIKAKNPYSDYSELEKSFPNLAKCIITRGSSCIVYNAHDSENNTYLVKQFITKEDESFSLKINHKISEYYQEKGSNYFLKQIYEIIDKKTQYHLFLSVNGATVKCEKPVNDKDFSRIFKEFKGFVESLDALHQLGYIHFDIKAENIFKFKANDSSPYIMQVLDFGSVALRETICSNIKANGYTYASTAEWYDEYDKALYCQEMNNEDNDDSLAAVLDLTAAVKVLCHIVCNDIAGFDLKLMNENVCKYEGILSKLYEMWDRATNEELAKRYVNCSDLIEDIDILIEAIDGDIKHMDALRLVSKNTLIDGKGNQACYDKLISDLKRDLLKSGKSEGSNYIHIYQLKDEINVGIMPDIQMDNKIFGAIGELSPLERCLNNNLDKKNIAFFGNGGGGKSIALKYLYLKSLFLKKGKIPYLYLSGKDFNDNNVLSRDEGITSIASMLSMRYKGCKIEELVQNPKIKLIILFDALDEVPDTIRNSIYGEIDRLNDLGNRFIMTSRDNISIKNGLAGIIQGEFQCLKEDQIREYAPEVYERNDKKLQELLRVPMLMSIYLKLNLDDEADNINCPEDLIREYLKEIYLLNDPKADETLFDKHVFEIAKYSAARYSKKDKSLVEARTFINNNKLDHIIRFVEYSTVEQVNGSSDIRKKKGYKAEFSHKLYEDYFKGAWLFDFFSKIISEEHLTVSSFAIEALADVNKNFPPYWINEFKKKLLDIYLSKDEASNDEIIGNLNECDYSVINDFIQRFKKADITKKFRDSKKQMKQINGIRNIIHLIILCCDGNLADIEKNKPLVEFSDFTKYFLELADFEHVRSAFVPWYINVHKHIKKSINRREKKRISFNENMDLDSEYRDNEQNKSLEDFLYSKHLVVSKWNLSCKSKQGSLYNKFGTKLICATRADDDNGSYSILDDVRSISRNAFKYCVCEEFKTSNNLFLVKDGVLYEKKTKKLIKYPTHKKVQKFELLEAKKVAPYAFANVKNLKNADLSILKSKSLPKSLFEDSFIESVELPGNITCIGKKAFYGCNRLTSLYSLEENIQQNATFILNKAFYGCTKLTDLSGISNIKYIGSLALADTKSLEQLPISNKYWYIAKNAFENSYVNQPPQIEKT